MGRVNISAVEKICNTALNTQAVKNKIATTQRQMIASGKKNNAQSQLRMEQAGKILLDLIIEYLPHSLSKMRSELTNSILSIDTNSTYYQLDINFPATVLKRTSLYPEEYEGIDNIIALFNNGYDARSYVYGHWATAGKRVRSVTSRPALQFMQEAISNFNNTYGSQYSCRARLGDQYK